MIQSVKTRAFQTMRSGFVSSGSFAAQIEAFLLVDAVYPLPVIFPAFSAQQGVYPIVAIADPNGGNFFYSFSDGPVIPAATPIVPGRSIQLYYLAGPLNGYPVVPLEALRQPHLLVAVTSTP